MTNSELNEGATSWKRLSLNWQNVRSSVKILRRHVAESPRFIEDPA